MKYPKNSGKKKIKMRYINETVTEDKTAIILDSSEADSEMKMSVPDLFM